MPDQVWNEQFNVGDRSISYLVRYSSRARRMRMVLAEDETLSVILPLGMSRKDAADFVRSNLAWIERTRLKLSLRGRRKKDQAPSFPQEFDFPLTGEHFTFRYEWSNTCWTGVREAGDLLLVTGRVLDAEHVREAIRQYLIRKAERILEPRLRELAAGYGFRAGKVSFRFQRGRWGSCSRGKDISLNAQLLFLSPEDVRYVLIHELCHTREMNHSTRFWREVERYCPDWRRTRARLVRIHTGHWI